MDISSIRTIRKVAMQVANREAPWDALAMPLELSINTLDDLFTRSGILTGSGDLEHFTSYQDIMFTICLYFSMRPVTKFTKTTFPAKR